MFGYVRVNNRLLFELLFKTFYYFVDNSYFELLELPFEIFTNDLIQLPHGLSEFGVEMVFNNIISSRIISLLLARKLHRNESPFISDLVMKSEEFLLLFLGPLRLNHRIKVLLVPK